MASDPSQGSTSNVNECENPTPMDLTVSSTPTSSTEGNVDSNDQIENEDDDTMTSGRKRKFQSLVWQHFDYNVVDEVPKATCKFCKKKLRGNIRNGTKCMINHHQVCPMRKNQTTLEDVTQKKLMRECSGENEQVLFVHGFSQEVARRDLVDMIIMHEYPLNIVERCGFRKFVKSLQPSFTMISRNTLRSDIFKVFEHEKGQTMKVLGKAQSKVAVSIDMWSSQNQTHDFMAVTAHWIDSAWTLQSRILRFVYVPYPHTVEVLAEELLLCFSEWNISRRLSTIIVDNCTSNDALIPILKDRLDLRTLPLNGKFFHMRCCAHILNLIVQDGLNIIESSIENVRDSVAYWKATPERDEIFRQVCDSFSVDHKRKLKLDCKTRWNSTFVMLQHALMYKEVFSKLAKWDRNYKCLPSDDDWDKVKDICSRLEIFYDMTLFFYGSKYPTANDFFPKIVEIRLALSEWVLESDVTIRTMAQAMFEKFQKYWDVIHGLMGVACVFDPRYKLVMLECCYKELFEFDVGDKVKMIKDLCYSLFCQYESKLKNARPTCDNPNLSITSSSLTSNSSGCSKRKNILEMFDTYVKRDASGPQKSEMDLYLEEAIIPRTKTFDILEYWKAAQPRYPILSLIAMDIYAIPISTVVSDAAFSTSGRILSSHRNRLHPNILEALMCAKDWLLSNFNQEERESYVRSLVTSDVEGHIDDTEEE